MAVKVFLTHTVASPLSADKAETVRQKVAATLDIPQADVVLLPPGVTATVVEVADKAPFAYPAARATTDRSGRLEVTPPPKE